MIDGGTSARSANEAATNRIVQAFIPALLLLVTSVFADVAYLEPASLDLGARELPSLKSEFLDTKEAHPRLVRRNDIDDYDNRNQNNQIPPFIVCNTFGGLQSIMYTSDDIWAAFQEGLRRYRNNDPAIYNGREFPHRFGFMDEDLQDVNIGNGDQNNAQEYPLVSLTDPNYGGVYGGGGYPPGADRVVFDTNGLFLGVITHRGMQHNGFHWCQPTNINAYGIGNGANMFPGRQPGYMMPLGGFVAFFKR